VVFIIKSLPGKSILDRAKPAKRLIMTSSIVILPASKMLFKVTGQMLSKAVKPNFISLHKNRQLYRVNSFGNMPKVSLLENELAKSHRYAMTMGRLTKIRNI